jgi:hypothetical protein
VVSVVAERCPNFAAIHDELITIANRSRLHITEVGTMVWFGEPLTPDLFAGQDIFDVSLTIFLSANI